MHTYIKSQTAANKEKPWIVLFSMSEAAQTEIRVFRHEIQAIAFVNCLNGGNQDITLIKELIEEESKPKDWLEQGVKDGWLKKEKDKTYTLVEDKK